MRSKPHVPGRGAQPLKEYFLAVLVFAALLLR
jgi:hypothetical protein